MLRRNGIKSNQESFRAAHDKLVKEIVVAISGTGLGRFWEQPTGAAYRNDKLVRYGLIGCADITGIMVGGKRIEIEVKTGKAVQSDEQKFFESMIKMMGGIYFVAHSIDEAVTLVKSMATVREQ